MREETYLGTPKTRTEVAYAQSKVKGKVEDKESLDETPRSVDWKLVLAV